MSYDALVAVEWKRDPNLYDLPVKYTLYLH